MNILAFDSTAKTASVALWRDGVVLAEMFADTGKTHSEILLPMAENVCDRAHASWSDIDYYAVTAGPGSFTGVRIGVATAKGLAFSEESTQNCVAVSTLEAIAFGLLPLEGIFVSVMDARRNEVYNAIFRSQGGTFIRLCPDRAISLAALGEELLSAYPNENIYLAGDGYAVAYEALSRLPLSLRETPPLLRPQRASAVAMCAASAIARGEVTTADRLAPTYLRLPQAERDRLAKEKENQK